MRCPTLAELPPPPPGKIGWPWTEESSQLPAIMPDGRSWPEVSIVTPSYNQGLFLEATIRSVLLQGYPNLAYYIVDGGSTDESVAIIRKYEPWLRYWVSEPDQGQTDAINKGFGWASGEVFAWLNSDDIYEPGTLQTVMTYFANQPECALLYGNGWYTDASGNKTEPCKWIRPFDHRLLLTFNFILQPAAFWRRSLWERTGGLDSSCQWAMDWEWLIRATASVQPHYLPVDLACWRIRPEIKTLSGGRSRRAEIAAISRKYGGIWQPTYLVYQLDRLAWWSMKHLGHGPGGRVLEHLRAPIRWAVKEKLWGGRYLF